MKLKGDKVIWIIVVLLSMISVAAVYSSSNALVYFKYKSNYTLLVRQMTFILFSLLLLFIFYYIPIGVYRLLSILAMPAAIALLLYTIVGGKRINEAARWITLFGVTIHTGEIAKIALIAYMARVLEFKEFKRFKEFFYWIVLPVGILITLVLYGSVSAGLLLAIIGALLLIIAGVKQRYILYSSLIAGAVLVVIIGSNLLFGLFPRLDTAMARFSSFSQKNESRIELTVEERQRQYDRTFQADMAKIAVKSG
ncbi:MAG: FtsW/RodA/SpoVE family cell cycle protein, partial [Bacteroidales bacterium]